MCSGYDQVGIVPAAYGPDLFGVMSPNVPAPAGPAHDRPGPRTPEPPKPGRGAPRKRHGTTSLRLSASAAILPRMTDRQRPSEIRTARPGLVVALDGPGSSGKSSVGAAAALELGYRFCDTGLLYRAATWLALERHVAPEDPAGLIALVDEIELAPDEAGRLDRVRVDGRDETAEVHTARVDERVSEVSRVPELRAALLARQRDLAAAGRIVMAGRDIGSVVLPDADLKIYLDASVEERANRRAAERGIERGSNEAQVIEAQLRRRDEIDSGRPVAPLRIAEGALVLHTDGNTFEQTVAHIVNAVRAAQDATPAAHGAHP